MPRQRDNTADWFPHIVKHGETIAILEARFKNDGYAFWFKLLELLGRAPGHYIRAGKAVKMEYLAAYANLSVETVTEMLDLLAEIDGIDPVLWSKKIIWSQNFVDGLGPLYSKRAGDTPKKEDIRPGNDTNEGVSGDIRPGNDTNEGVSGESIPRVEKSLEELEEKDILSGKSESDPDTGQSVTDSIPVPYSEIVEYLNEKADTRYPADTKATRRLIKARWNEGHRLDDFKKAIAWAAWKWKNDEKMVDYIRPQTLFTGKMEAYIENFNRERNGGG